MSDPKVQFKVLGELKQLDQKIFRLETDVSRIPGELGKLEETLNARRTKLAAAKEAFEGIEKKVRKSELDVKEKEDSLRKAESKMMEVKTNEEYQAAMRENDGQKKEKSKLEESALLAMGDLETKRNDFKKLEGEFKTFEATLNGDKTQLEAERAKLMNQLEALLAERASAVARLEPRFASTYNRLLKAGKGIAVCGIQSGSCLGCNMIVRPQLYNEVLGCKVVHQCPSCGRLLVPPSVEELDAAESKDVGQA